MAAGSAKKRNPTLVAFGLAVQRRRRAIGISQEEAAARSKVHRTYYADIERGTRNVGLINVVKIAKGLGVPPANLLREIE